MGRSAKFYKKPSLKEKQALSASKSRSAGLSDVKEASRHSAIQRSAESAQKRLAKAKVQLEAEMEKSKSSHYPHPQQQQRQAKAEAKAEAEAEAEVEMQDDEQNDEHKHQKPKRRTRNRQRRDYGPMPRDMGIDYLAQWDSRAK